MICFRIDNVAVFDTPISEINSKLNELIEFQNHLKNKLLYYCSYKANNSEDCEDMFIKINSIIEDIEDNAAAIRLLTIAKYNPEDVKEMEI